MIYLEIKGRLGNQFFRYAFARWLQIKRGNKDKFVFGFSNMKGKDAKDGWEDQLKYFNVQPYESSNNRLVYKFGNFIQKLLDSCFFVDLRVFARNDRYLRMTHARKWLGLLDRVGLIHNVEEHFDYKVPTTKNVIIDGGFQQSTYFNEIRPVLLKEFTPKYPLRNENKDLYDIINNTNSVCISIRRGDYVTVPAFNKVYNICTKEYFDKAVEIIKQKVEDPTFIMFSDDIDWCKKNLDLGCKTYYESGTDSIWEKVRLMSACKHFIISNSSFSWMVQYLGQFPNKIVVSPNRWYNGEMFPSYLIEDSFIKINV